MTWFVVALVAGLCAAEAARAATFASQTPELLGKESLAALAPGSDGEIITVDDLLFHAADVIESSFVGNPWPGGVLVYNFGALVRVAAGGREPQRAPSAGALIHARGRGVSAASHPGARLCRARATRDRTSRRP
jgi:hypothetical protein